VSRVGGGQASPRPAGGRLLLAAVPLGAFFISALRCGLPAVGGGTLRWRRWPAARLRPQQRPLLAAAGCALFGLALMVVLAPRLGIFCWGRARQPCVLPGIRPKRSWW
jgi:hypothetical protein